MRKIADKTPLSLVPVVVNTCRFSLDTADGAVPNFFQGFMFLIVMILTVRQAVRAALFRPSSRPWSVHAPALTAESFLQHNVRRVYTVRHRSIRRVLARNRDYTPCEGGVANEGAITRWVYHSSVVSSNFAQFAHSGCLVLREPKRRCLE